MGEELKRWLRSGFIQDTLFQVTGRPKSVRLMSGNERRLLPGAGRFRPERDQIVLRGGRPRAKMLRTLTHEAGHRLFDSLLHQAPGGNLSDRDERLLTRQLPSAFDAMRNLKDPSARQRHAQTSAHEHFATAFQRAMDVLRIPAGPEREEALTEAETEMPGSRTMFEYLQVILSLSDRERR